MKPILSPRSLVRSLSEMFEISLSSKYISPRLTVSRDDKQLSNVVFPLPEGPVIARISPLEISRDTPRRAETSVSPMGYIFQRSAALSISPMITD